MKTIFIADTHLSESQPKITSLFLQFLAKEAVKADALYILGDFFNVWIGDDDDTAYNRMIINSLKNITKSGVSVYLMHGNRDFLIGKRFLKAANCDLLKDPAIVEVYGTRLLLTHGDLLCTHDLKYLIFRKKVRNWLAQKLFLCKSLQKRKIIADKMRQASMAYNSVMPGNLLNVTQSEVERFMRKYRSNLLIHGHLHKEAMYQFKLDGQPAKRILLGSWSEKQGSFLTCQPTNLENGLDFQINTVSDS